MWKRAKNNLNRLTASRSHVKTNVGRAGTHKAAYVERSAGRLAGFEAAADNALIIGSAVRRVLRALRSSI